MATKRDIANLEEYRKLFQTEIDQAEELEFKEKFSELVLELDILDVEFLKAGRGCGGPVEDVFEHLRRVIGRMGEYHFSPTREKESTALYREVDEAIASVAAYRNSCEY